MDRFNRLRLRRFGFLAILLAIAVLMVVFGLGPRALRLAARDPGAAALPDEYRYRFQRASRGSVTRALEQEIAFYQERVRRDPQGGLDLASLAGTYLGMARATGDLSWYLLAEQAARRSLANLRFQNDGAVRVLAKIAEARHDFAEAIRLARKIGDEDALAILATANLARGDIPAAAAVAEALVARSPTLGSFMLLGLVRVARGEDDVAAAAFNRAIASEEVGEPGGSALVRTQFGRFHARRGRHNLAHALYGEALRILPQYPLALVHLAELDARVGRYREAEGHLSRVVTISAASPNVFDHVVLRGLARLKDLQGDAAGARALQDEAEAGLRRDVAQGAFGHRRELARLLLERGRPEDLSKALELMRAEVRVRHDPETLDALAWVLTRAGEWQEARQAMRDALQWGLRDAGMHYRAGTIEEALGNHAQARKFFASALQIDPTFNEHARRVSGMGL